MKRAAFALIILLAVGLAAGLYVFKPRTKRVRPVRPVPLVETARLVPSDERVFVEAQGTVIPARRISLQSEVEGRIVHQSPELMPGGLFEKGQVILRVDARDYDFRVSESRAGLEEALFELEVEKGRQVIARREWELLEEQFSKQDSGKGGKGLALREPHLKRIRARLEGARSRLKAAELNRERTTLRAPFNSMVIEEFVDEGQLAGRQMPVATLVGTDRFWIQVSVSVSVLDRISVHSGGAAAEIIVQPTGGGRTARRGRVLKLLGDLDPKGRMARVIIELEDPLNLKKGAPGADDPGGPVLLGSYVTAKIDAGSLEGVYAVPRRALREGDVLWVLDREGKLGFRNALVLWRREGDVLVNADVLTGDRLILSRLQTPLPGMKLKSNGIDNAASAK